MTLAFTVVVIVTIQTFQIQLLNPDLLHRCLDTKDTDTQWQELIDD